MMIVVLPLQIMSSVLTPMIAELHEKGRMRELERLVRTSATLTAIPSLVGLIVLCIASPWFLQLLYGAFYRQGAPILALLCVGQMVSVWAGSNIQVLMMCRCQKDAMVITLICGIYTFVAGILLARSFGIIGVGVATASANILHNLLLTFVVRMRLGIWTQSYWSISDIKKSAASIFGRLA